MTDREMARLLRWYPEAWRCRYGQELAALLEDTYGGRTPPLWCRLALARAGVVERCRAFGLTGSTVSAAEGVRAGTLLVLWAWALSVVACAEFANIGEGWRKAIPVGRTLPTAGDVLVLGAAACSAVVVLAGAALCAGPLVRFLGDGGWPKLKGHVIRSVGLTVAVAVLFIAMLIWSRHLTAPQRDGRYLPYGLIAITLAIFSAATVLSWTATGTAAARGITLDARLARRAAVLAFLLATAMLVLSAGTVLWWVAIAARDPWFLAGTPPGTPGTVAPTLLVAACAAMGLAALAAAAGARRAMACRSRLT